MPKAMPPSEYGGRVGPNTVQPKPPDALSSGEKLRLFYLTGQEEDTHAPRDPRMMEGGTYTVPGTEED